MIMPRWLQQFYMEIHLNARTIAIQTNEDVLWSLATTYHRRKFKREKKTNWIYLAKKSGFKNLSKTYAFSWFRHFDTILSNIERSLNEMTMTITRPHASNAIVHVSFLHLFEFKVWISNYRCHWNETKKINCILDKIGSCAESGSHLQRNHDRMGHCQRIRWEFRRWFMGWIAASGVPKSSRSYTFSDASLL